MEKDSVVGHEMKAFVGAPKAKLERMKEGLKLAECIIEFTDKMTEKIALHIEDRSGWNNEENAKGMHSCLMDALKDGDYISVANYAMFLDNLGYKPGRSASE